MSASGNGIAGELCGKWMPRKRTTCARTPGHGGPCTTAEAMERARQRFAERIAANGRVVNPVAKRRWNQTYKLARYGLTQELFDRLLEIQQFACAMCHTKFEEDQPVFIDHDHACCPDEKSSCGKCVRGLLCLSCNTTLGLIERKYDLARAYLDSPRASSSRWPLGHPRGLVSSRHPGRLAQRERVSLTRRRSQVQILYRPPGRTPSLALENQVLGPTVCRASGAVSPAG